MVRVCDCCGCEYGVVVVFFGWDGVVKGFGFDGVQDGDGIWEVVGGMVFPNSGGVLADFVIVPLNFGIYVIDCVCEGCFVVL